MISDVMLFTLYYQAQIIHLIHQTFDFLIFNIDLPNAYKLLMQSEKSKYIAIEYLSAEPWVENFHLKPSIDPESGLIKTFFYPGFTGQTGGLIREIARAFGPYSGGVHHGIEAATPLRGIGHGAAALGHITQVGLDGVHIVRALDGPHVERCHSPPTGEKAVGDGAADTACCPGNQHHVARGG
jgi:hypothetical protein